MKSNVGVLRRIASIAVGALVTSALMLTGAPAAIGADAASPPPVLERDDNVVTADPIPTVQIDNGYVWAQATIGSTVYAVGKFDNARAPLANPGTQLTARSNVLAYDINTGSLLSFAPAVNGVVKAVVPSADGSKIFIGGSFTSVNGQTRYNIAALDAVTGELVPSFQPSVGGTGVYALATDGTNLYAGGLFTQATATARKNLAAFNAGTGALQAWAPQTDLQVDAMVMDPAGHKVIAGGRFSQVNGDVNMRGAVALDKLTGAVDTDWAVPKVVENGHSTGKGGIFSLNTDATGVYGTGWVYGGLEVGNLEGTFAAEADTGEIRWIADCLGDHYGVYSTGTTVYTTSHTHACSTMGLHPEQNPREHRYAEAYTADARGLLGRNPHAGSQYQNWQGTPGPSAYYWTPDFTVGRTTGLGQAGLSITGVGNTISIAGEFGTVNNLRFEGIVRFSTDPPGGAKQKPRLAGSAWTPTATSVIPGRVRVAFQANWDRDDLNLTYDLRRSGVSEPVATTRGESTWWNRPGMRLEDRTAAPGSTHTYTLVARDGDGNASSSDPVTVTVADGEVAEYVDTVVADEPQMYYPLGDSDLDWAGANPPVSGSDVRPESPGIAQSSSGYSVLNGTSNARIVSKSRVAAPTDYSTELWFKTTTALGGKLIGYGNASSGSSGSYDRHVYMRNDGHLVFGVYPGQVRTVETSAPYNDGQWHHVVASLSGSGMRLYVDGQLEGFDSSTTSAQDYLGYWRIGGDNLGGWPSAPTSIDFAGAIDEVAVYPYELNSNQIRTHYGVGSGFQAPTAAFSTVTDELALTVDGGGSTAEGAAAITSYTWDFGDGSDAGSGLVAAHTYAEAGTFTVTLTVKDSNGLSSTAQQEVTVRGPNALPSAVFTATANGLMLTTDASGSSDPDGAITSYRWNWGDGTPESEGQTASHRYSSNGSYDVTLMVRDDRGGETEQTHSFTVTHAAPLADFSLASSGLRVDTDGAGSSASDGAALSYSWAWGDETANSSGPTASHTYSSGGDYDITLTVTDSLGAVDSLTRTAHVSAELLAASDAFGRVVSNGWGTADAGGVWAVTGGSAAVASVSGEAGVLDLPAAGGRSMILQGTSVSDSRTDVTYTLNEGPSSGAIYAGLESRYQSGKSYRSVVWHRNDGKTWLLIQRNGVNVMTAPLTSANWAAGSVFNLASEVTGTGPVKVRAKIWAAGAPEPASWQLEATDAAPGGLSAPGASGIYGYRAGSATGVAPLAFDGFQLKDLSAPGEQTNTPPVAAFTVSPSGLSVSVDATGSTDGDGSITSYEWEFGDGTVETGATATHVYTSAGTYQVKLTVTDDDGATHSTTHAVTVTAVEAGNSPPVAAFTSTAVGLSISVDASAAADADGSITSYAWEFGDGGVGTGATASHVFASAGTYAVKLTVTDDDGATHSVTHDVVVKGADVPPQASAEDTFDRNMTTGWGSASVGGAWTITGGPQSATSVSTGAGVMVLAAGAGRDAALNALSLSDSVLETQFRLAPGFETGGSYVGVTARGNGSSRYIIRAWLRPDGTVWLVAQTNSATLLVQPLAGVRFSEGETYSLKASVSGSSPTTISAKFWKTNTTEPLEWQLTTTDSSAGLQGNGAVGLTGYRTGSATAAATLSFDSFIVRPPQ